MIKQKSKKNLSKNEKIQAFFSILVASFAGGIIWTNNSIDLLNKFGWETVNGGQAFLVFAILFLAGLSWFVVSIAKKIS